MPNYRETPVSGAAWTRSNRITVENPYNGLPTITFLEEQVVDFGGEPFIKYSGQLGTDFSTPYEEMQLLNPLDDSVIGTAMYVNVQILLYSLYRHLTTKRDTPPPEPPPEEPVI